MSEIRTVDYLAEDLEHAHTLNLAVPEVVVDTDLDAKLARRFLALDVDSTSIVEGITQANIEQPLKLKIDTTL